MFVGAQYITQRISRIHDGSDNARHDARPYAIANGVKASRPLRCLQPPQRAACEGQAFHKQRREVDFTLHAAHDADRDYPAVGRGQIQIRLHQVTPGNIQDHVDFSRKPGHCKLFEEIVLTVIGHELRAQCLHRFTAFCVTSSGEHGGAHDLCHLYADRTDTAAAAVNKDGLTVRQSAAFKDVVPNGQQRLR